MSIGRRLEEERKSKGYRSQNAFADALGISYPTISRWENDTTTIPSDKCALMNELGLDILYILTGKKAATVAASESTDLLETKGIAEAEGAKPAISPVSVAGEVNSDGIRSASIDPSDYAWIPLYDIDVSAGNGSIFDNERILTYLAFTRYSLRKQGLQPDKLACVRVRGDSMEPAIHSRDTVMIDMRVTHADSGIFVFRMGTELYLKRLVREAGGIRVISDNSVYPSWLIAPDADYQIVGKRVWHARWGE